MSTSHMVPYGSPELSELDAVIFRFHVDCGYQDEYEYRIADRNDYAVMVARTVLAARACRATRDRAMPA